MARKFARFGGVFAHQNRHARRVSRAFQVDVGIAGDPDVRPGRDPAAFEGEQDRFERGLVARGVECADETACVLVVSLDGAPLAKSKRILVQCATEERPFGWRVEAGLLTSWQVPQSCASLWKGDCREA